MQELFPDIVGMLGWQLSDLVNDDLRWRDFSRHELTTALRLLVAHLAVYHTYRAIGQVPSASDRAVIDEAAASAIAANPRADPQPIDFIRTLLRGDYPGEKAQGDFFSSASVEGYFRERVREHLRKAVSEAKRHTSDVSPNESYLAAVGALASVAQVILKASAPGIPDFYQGNETWDFSLVDPDNRRPVDFATRRSLLELVREAAPEVLLRDWESGALKLFVTRRLLEMRRECPEVFRAGDYCPLDVIGPADVVAFSRQADAPGMVVILPRRFREVSEQTRRESFVATTVTLPRASKGWRDILTGRVLRPEGPVSLAELFAVFPFSVLRVNP